MNPLRRAWRAASAPEAFFADLDPSQVRLVPAFTTAAVCAGIGAVLVGLLAARATGSVAWPFVVGVPAVALPYLAILVMLGSLVLMRPGGMELRAFEVVAWAWVPTGWLAVAVTPVGWFAPGPALLVAALLLPPWHFWVLWRGVEAFAPARTRTTAVLYGVVVFAVPFGITVFTLWVLSTLP